MTAISAVAADLLFWVYLGVAATLLAYGLNAYVMIFLFRRRQWAARDQQAAARERHADLAERADAPVVTTQIPLYNEANVCERCIRAAAAMRYPEGRHQIQVLDDSTDETRGIVDGLVAALRAAGHDIAVVRRAGRAGFKAGALAHGLEQARGELLAIFDADFVPGPDFLLAAVPCFLEAPTVGLVQARWGHLNRECSLLTRAQSIGIDGHFMIEQAARDWNGLYMNFNGTAGLWRREAIVAAGGWQADTLTEDMDLSYRMQLVGWQTRYLADLVVPAELPESVIAFKSQQFRWAKGSIETARKLGGRVLRAPEPLFKKLQAFFHLTHYMVHPLMLAQALLALPVLLSGRLALGTAALAAVGTLLAFSMCAPSALYVVSQRAAYPDWSSRILWLPSLIMVGVGLAVSNTIAVVQALVGHRSPFVRTPKRGGCEAKRYALPFPLVSLVELGVGAWCLYSLWHYLVLRTWLIGPFLAIYACGFLFIGMLTIAHASGALCRPAGARRGLAAAAAPEQTGARPGASGVCPRTFSR